MQRVTDELLVEAVEHALVGAPLELGDRRFKCAHSLRRYVAGQQLDTLGESLIWRLTAYRVRDLRAVSEPKPRRTIEPFNGRFCSHARWKGEARSQKVVDCNVDPTGVR